MTITLTKTKLAAALLAVVMLIPATALATHVFDDVPDGAFYAVPVEWAFDNGITTGTSATTFSPLDDVTRGESVTFLQRYNENVVEPAIEAAVGMDGLRDDPDAAIDSTTVVELATLALDESGTKDMVVNAHVQIENAGSTQGRFDVYLRLDGCAGDVIAEAGLRTGVTSSTFVSSTVSLTGFLDDVAGDSHIALCARKVAPGNADGVAHDLGITAVWS